MSKLGRDIKRKQNALEGAEFKNNRYRNTYLAEAKVLREVERIMALRKILREKKC
jgi:hypothetical protein